MLVHDFEYLVVLSRFTESELYEDSVDLVMAVRSEAVSPKLSDERNE